MTKDKICVEIDNIIKDDFVDNAVKKLKDFANREGLDFNFDKENNKMPLCGRKDFLKSDLIGGIKSITNRTDFIKSSGRIEDFSESGNVENSKFVREIWQDGEITISPLYKDDNISLKRTSSHGYPDLNIWSTEDHKNVSRLIQINNSGFVASIVEFLNEIKKAEPIDITKIIDKATMLGKDDNFRDRIMDDMRDDGLICIKTIEDSVFMNKFIKKELIDSGGKGFGRDLFVLKSRKTEDNKIGICFTSDFKDKLISFFEYDFDEIKMDLDSVGEQIDEIY